MYMLYYLYDARSYLQAHHLRGKHRTIPAKQAIAVDHTYGDTAQVVSKDGRDISVPQLLVFSAFDKSGAYSAYIKGFCGCYPPNFFSNDAFTLATCRKKYTWKSFCILEIQNDGENLERLLGHGLAISASLLNLGLLFTSQGAQWHGMGRELLSNNIFAESVSRSQQYLSDLGCGWSIVSQLTDDKFS